jgi:serine/threonine protein kinase
MVSSSHLYCMQCGAANMPHANFCVICGHSLQLDLSCPLPAVHAIPKIPSVTPATPATPPPSLLPQSLLKQRYRILAQIGKGGFGEVYKAEDSQFTGRLVAIKSMSLDSLNSREAIEAAEAFEREALMLANLMHPNLPSIYDYFNENSRSYLVMSFIEGMTLEDYLKIRGGCLPVEKVLPIGIQLCSVLGYLHKRQPAIIFRDLKPTNVMRTPDRQLYLIDFGVARLFKHGQTRDTIALGSPGYAAPEQYGKAQTTPQADIYSLGATLHHLLSGTDPSDAPFIFAPLHIAAYPDLNTLIMHMLETNPGKRPMSMSTVKQELQRIALGHSGEWAQQNWQSNALHYASEQKQSSPPPKVVPGLRPLQPPKPMSAGKPVNNDAGRVQHAQPWPSPPSQQQARGQQQMFYQQPSPPQSPRGILPRRAVLIGSVTGVIAMGGLLTCLLTQKPFPVVVQSDPVQPPQNPVPTMPPQPPNPASSTFVAVAWAPGGNRIIAGGGPGTVSVMDSAGNLINIYDGHTAPISSLAWSPDGKQVASASYDTTVQIWNPDTDKNIATYRENIGSVQSLAWSPRGKYIASADYAHNVNVWDATSLKTLVTYKNHIDQVLTLAWSPDGKYLASGSADNTVQVWDPITGNMVFNNHSHAGAVDSVAWSPDGVRIASASQDHTVRLWNALSGTNVYIYPGHTASVNSVAWSPSGRYIASGSMDTTVQIWSAVDGHIVYTYRAHTGPVLSVAWSPSGHIVSVDADGNLHVWTAPTA